VPITDPFSSYGAGRPWIAYSWLFEIITYGLHSKFGLLGLVLFTVILSLIIAGALHLLVRRAHLPFPAEVGITAVGLFCLKPVMTPRPWLFSILFFILELHVLLAARKSRNFRLLYWLPLIFLFWANIHVQFIYGLGLLALIAAEPLVRKLIHPAFNPRDTEVLPYRHVLIATILSLAATLINPYHVQIYKPIFEYAVQTRVFQNIEELHPMFFQTPEDWLVLSLALGAAFALGWHREAGLFPYLLLAMGAFLAFRARRDAWVLVVASLAIISERQTNGSLDEEIKLTAGKWISVAGGVILSLFAIGAYRNISESSLMTHVAKTFPADAVAFVKKSNLNGPLYNHLDWGGYLIWTLPNLPVSMDGRTNLYGAERIELSLATWAGYPGWSANPELDHAGLIIANTKQPLSSLLRTDTRFQLVYKDEVAAVFVANER
jgi:hypothetical protein